MSALPLAAGDVPHSPTLAHDKIRKYDPDKSGSTTALVSSSKKSDTVLVLTKSIKILKDQRYDLLENLTSQRSKYQTLKQRMKKYLLLDESIKIFCGKFLKLTSYYAFKSDEQVLLKAQILKRLKEYTRELKTIEEKHVGNEDDETAYYGGGLGHYSIQTVSKFAEYLTKFTAYLERPKIWSDEASESIDVDEFKALKESLEDSEKARLKDATYCESLATKVAELQARQQTSEEDHLSTVAQLQDKVADFTVRLDVEESKYRDLEEELETAHMEIAEKSDMQEQLRSFITLYEKSKTDLLKSERMLHSERELARINDGKRLSEIEACEAKCRELDDSNSKAEVKIAELEKQLSTEKSAFEDILTTVRTEGANALKNMELKLESEFMTKQALADSKVSELDQQVESLRLELEDNQIRHEASSTGFLRELDERKDTIAALESTITAHRNANKTLEQSLEESRTEILTLNERLDRSESKNHDMKEKLETAEDDRVLQEGIFASLQTQLDECEAKLLQQDNVQTVDTEHLEEQVEMWKRRASAMKDKNKDISSELAAAEEKVESLEAAASDFERIEAQNNILRSNHDEMSGALGAKSTEFDQLKAEYEQSSTELNSSREQVTRLEEDQTILRDNLETLQRQLDETCSMEEISTPESQQQVIEFEKKINQMDEHTRALQTKIQEDTVEKKRLTKEKKAHQKESEYLLQSLNKMENTVVRLKAELEARTASFECEQQKQLNEQINEDLQARIRDLESQLAESRAERKRLSPEEEFEQEALEDLQFELEELTLKNDNLQEELNNFEAAKQQAIKDAAANRNCAMCKEKDAAMIKMDLEYKQELHQNGEIQEALTQRMQLQRVNSDEIRAKLREKANEVPLLAEKLKRAESDLQTEKTEKMLLQESVEQINDDLGEERLKADLLREQLNQVESAYKSKDRLHQDEIKGMLTEKAIQLDKIDHLEREIKVKDGEMAAHQQNMTEMEGQQEGLLRESFHQEWQTAISQVMKLRKENKSLKTDLAKFTINPDRASKFPPLQKSYQAPPDMIPVPSNERSRSSSSSTYARPNSALKGHECCECVEQFKIEQTNNQEKIHQLTAEQERREREHTRIIEDLLDQGGF